MGFCDFLDSRKSLAKWTHRMFAQARQSDPDMPIQEVIDFTLWMRYRVVKPKAAELPVLEEGRDRVIDIFSFCRLIADAELLSHLSIEDRLQGMMEGESISARTYAVIDEQLTLLGHKKLSGKLQAMMGMDAINPEHAAQLYGNDPEFRWAMKQKRQTARQA